jgi:hypothetical protein
MRFGGAKFVSGSRQSDEIWCGRRGVAASAPFEPSTGTTPMAISQRATLAALPANEIWRSLTPKSAKHG